MNNKIERTSDYPSVSVIMTVYNGEQYLEEAVKSVLSQTYSHLELVITDDGSTDRTPEILTQLASADSRIKVISTANNGVSSARNRALAEMMGDIVTFIDSDDVLHPGALECMVQLMQANDADVVSGRMIMTGTEPKGWRQSDLQVTDVRVMNGKEALECSLYQRPAMNSVCQLIMRSGLFRGEGTLSFVSGRYEDLELTTRLFLRAGKVVCVDMFHYFYRQVDDSFIHKFSEKRLDALTVTAGIERQMSEQSEALRRAAYDRRFSACFNIFLLLAAEDDVKYQDVATECWREICRRRCRTLLNPKVRLKNKLGAILSYSGQKITKLVSRNI
ncbi:MAG: glycosyltransferase [Muribaculaceae bacterium]|nr:glycosyltransferase [Muribaculaceae bacterium]